MLAWMLARLRQNGATTAARVIPLRWTDHRPLFTAMPAYNHIYVTIKVTLKCNLACQYCYGRDNHVQGEEMTEEDARRALDFTCEYAQKVQAKSITLCWHGGEPFLFIRRLPALMDYANAVFGRCGIKVEHGTQTNATLLTPPTFDTIKKYFDGYIGVSVDLHSRYRTFANGTVSTDLAIRNIDNALNAGIRCGAINLITHDNLGRIDDIYLFYKVRGMNVRLSRVFPIGKDDDLKSGMYVSDEEFAGAMIRYFDLWANDKDPANNTDIVKLVSDLLLGQPSLCLREANCHKRYMAMAPKGEIYSCAEFDVPDSVIGNFLTQSVDEFIASDARERIARMAPVPESCHACRYERTCHGGCFRERFMMGYPYRCKSSVIYWDHVVEWLEKKGASLYALHGKNRDEQREIMRQVFKMS